MKYDLNSIKITLLKDKFYKNATLFYSPSKSYYLCRIKTFGQLFNIICIKYKIFNPELIQKNTHKYIKNKYIINEKRNEEIKKIKLIEKCIIMGNKLLNERSDYFMKQTSPDEIKTCNNFYITSSSFNDFITKIILPLLFIVANSIDVEWIQIPNHDGYWSEYEPFLNPPKNTKNNYERLYKYAKNQIITHPINKKIYVKLN